MAEVGNKKKFQKNLEKFESKNRKEEQKDRIIKLGLSKSLAQ